MGILYAAGFEVGGANTMTATVAGSAASISSGLYLPGAYTTASLLNPSDLTTTGAWTLTNYTAFSTAVKSAFDTATASTFTVSFSLSTGLYTISRATNFTLSFSTAADLRLRAALGFTGNKSGANTYTSDVVPYYVMVSAISGRTFEGNPDFSEPDDIADESVDDGGAAEVVTRKTSERLVTWMQAFESRANTFRARQTTGAWTWEQFFASTRGTHPFVCYDSADDPSSGDGFLYRLTAKGAAFMPERVSPDFSDYWTIRFAARELGYFA